MKSPPLLAGFAREEITPTTRLSLVGYEARKSFFPEGFSSLLDPLQVRAVALQEPDQGLTVLLLSFDLCLLDNELANHLREEIARANNLSPTRVILACTHTHSGPLPRLPAKAQAHSATAPKAEKNLGPLQTGGDPQEEEAYGAWICRQAVRASQRARQLMVPVAMEYGEMLTGLGYNRRVRQADGSIQLCWNQEEFPHLTPQPSPDPWLSLIRLVPLAGGSDFYLWGTGIHPVTLGKTSGRLSADWPGQTNNLLEKALASDRVIFFQGASGEVHPWHATGDQPAEVAALAEAMVAQLKMLARSTRAVKDSAPQPLLKQASTDWIHRGVTLPLSVIQLGPVLIPTLPLEFFASLNAELRQWWSGPLMTITMANGWHGYWPDRQSFAEGAYEVEVAKAFGRESGDGEALLAQIRAMATT